MRWTAPTLLECDAMTDELHRWVENPPEAATETREKERNTQ
jgi:hypothetical protein